MDNEKDYLLHKFSNPNGDYVSVFSTKDGKFGVTYNDISHLGEVLNSLIEDVLLLKQENKELKESTRELETFCDKLTQQLQELEETLLRN
jgi:regulator of replication initiation timing